MAVDKRATLREAAALVTDGARIGFGGGLGLQRRPMALARELVRAGRRNLEVYSVIGGLEIDLLIGAGVVASTHACYIGLDDMGQALNMQAAASAGTIAVHEYSEWVISARYRAANMGLPYIPWPSARFSDTIRDLGYTDVVCPYTGVTLIAVPAAELDIAVIHAPRADAAGNVELPVPLEQLHDVEALVARSAGRVVVCAEEVGRIDPTRTQLVGREVTAVVEMPRGAWPTATSLYPVDRAHLADFYIPAARRGDFGAYIDEFVLGRDN